MTNYGVDDGEGNALTRGVPENRIEIVAQNLADDLGEPVYYYPLGEEEASTKPVEVLPANPAMKSDGHS